MTQHTPIENDPVSAPLDGELMERAHSSATAAGDQEGTGGPVRQRKVSAFDLPTPEKRAFGDRLRKARELAGLNQAEAAEQMGYSQAVQLSNMENGNRMPPTHVLMRAAVIYGTTVDYLCGTTPEPDRDPLLSCQHLVAQRVAAQVRAMIGALLESNAHALRQLRADKAAVARLISLALETREALSRVRQLHPEFDDLRAGSALMHKAELAANAAAALAEANLRAERDERPASPGTADGEVTAESLALPRLDAIRPRREEPESDPEGAMHVGHA